MVPKSAADKPPKSPSTREDNSTVIWGDAELKDFIKVPRALIYLRGFVAAQPKYDKLKPHHLLFLLALAARKFKKKKIQAYWLYLGRDLGVEKDTVRKWAYQLEKMGLLTITRFRRKTDAKSPTPGFRNDKNAFDLTPFVSLVETAYAARRKVQDSKRRRRAAEETH